MKDVVEVGYGRRVGLVWISAMLALSLMSIVAIPSILGRVCGVVMLAVSLMLLGRALNPRPQVIIDDEGVTVGGRYTSAYRNRRNVAWSDVTSVGPIGLPAMIASQQSGRLPTWPRSFERFVLKEFRIERTKGWALIVREPLDRPLDEVRNEVARRANLPLEHQGISEEAN